MTNKIQILFTSAILGNFNLCFSLSSKELTKKLFAGPAAVINNNYPNGNESVFRKVKFDGKPDLTGIRLDFIDKKGDSKNRNYWYLTAADINGQPVELKGCFKYKVENNQLVIDLYKTDQHKYQNINVEKKLNLGKDQITYSWSDGSSKDLNKAAVLSVPLTEELFKKQIVFIDSKLTNLDNVLKDLAEFSSPYHLLEKKDCVVGELRSIPKIKNLAETHYSILENCSYLTMRYMEGELTPQNKNTVKIPPTMYNNK